ncbi:MAG TPA: hypothetical protein VEO01_19550 [Pseudonocardiaceae bacterium]|nr:hypothetical protein [Pseudonocardiaceae bacterium]
MTVRIPTHELVGLLTDLSLTAADTADSGATAGILLHTVRGYDGDAPGKTDLLVGTSTNRFTVGHSHMVCAGQIDPMLWLIGDVKAVLAVLKPLGKDKDHAVEIGVEDGKIAVAEDPDLFGDRLKVTFAAGDPGEFPHAAIWAVLSQIQMSPSATVGADSETKAAPAVAARTDFTAAYLKPMLTIAARRGALVQVFRYHQHLPVHVQIGDAYRGVVLPFAWRDEDRAAGVAPSGDVYPLAVQ